jgi:hypothetical protein
MDFRCPTCNKDLTVPDEYAGQLMKCPLCSNVFQAPALPPPPATYGLAPAPTPPAPPPPPPASAPPAPARTEQPKPTKTKEPPSPPPPPPPPGDYSHRRSIWINPRIVPFVAPVAHFLVFVLTFFPWLTFYPDPPTDKSESWMAWGAAFSGNPLLIPFVFLALLALPLVAVLTGLRLMSHVIKIPAGLQQIWPWRSAVVAFVVFLAMFFLAVQVLTGFNANNLPAYLVQRTIFAWLALGLEFIAFVSLLIDFWLELRGPTRPAPRIDLNW